MRRIWFAVSMMILIAVVLLLQGETMPVLAGDPVQVSKVAGSRPPIPSPDIVVTMPTENKVHHRNGYLSTHWNVTEPLRANPDFELKLLKGKAHTVIATLPSGGRIDPVGHYQATWRIPRDQALGTDYFVQVKHVPTGKKGFSPLFTIAK